METPMEQIRNLLNSYAFVGATLVVARAGLPDCHEIASAFSYLGIDDVQDSDGARAPHGRDSPLRRPFLPADEQFAHEVAGSITRSG